MITTTALEAQNRARAEAPVVLVVTRRRAPSSDAAVRAVTAATERLGVDTLAIDVDDVQNAAFLDDLRVQFVPEVLVLHRGVVLDRGVVRDAEDAQAVLSLALRRVRRAAG